MSRLRYEIRATVFLVATIGVAGPSARADYILQNYEFQNQPGNETFVPPSNALTGLTGVNFTEGPTLVTSTGASSINASGWNASSTTSYYQFGFNIAAGYSATVDSLDLATRSSNTGPGTLNIVAYVNGGATGIVVATITQSGTTYNDNVVNFTTSVTGTSSLVFQIVATNLGTDALGTAPVGSTGTFRVGDDNTNGSTTPPPFAINGTILVPTVVPEPASIAMTALGLGVAAFAARRRKALRARCER